MVINENKYNPNIKEVINTKEKVETQRYFPNTNKFMDICYNPVLNDSGEVIFVIERQKDFTEKKALDSIQKKSESNFRKLIDSASVVIMVIVSDNIVFLSEGGRKIFGEDYDNIIGKNIYSFLPKEIIKITMNRVKYIIKNKIENITREYKISLGKSKTMEVELTSGYFVYNGLDAIRVEIRSINKLKKELNRAAKLQRDGLQYNFPIQGKVDMKSLYLPCKMVSGDFYRIHKIDDNYAVGMIWDATGKGLAAALNVYALDVLFNEVIQVCKNPLEIIEKLNKKIIDNFDEIYIAACCFSFDFRNRQLEVVGAGINEFLMQRWGCEVEEVQVKGTPLGMFSNSLFTSKKFTINLKDKFYFFTDGFEFLLDSDRIIQKSMEKCTVNEFVNFLTEYMSDLTIDNDGQKDDCTMVALEIIDI